ncbi:MAG TPA: hypothetical protein VGL25_04470, partial [Casimicrobiaceae bacterium]
PEGLSYAAAANQLVWLLNEANRLRLTGVGLKDHSELRPVQVNPDAASFNLSSQRSRTQT